MSQPTEKEELNEILVSIIIPFFNREEFLAESVASVLEQTFQSWELLLIDDGSTDRSAAIAQQFVKDHPQKIFYHTHENCENRGASSSRNLGIKCANGDFITFLDSDDVFFPNTLEVELKALARNPDADVVCGNLMYWFSWADRSDIGERDFVVNLGVQLDKLYEAPSLLIHNLQAGGRKPGIGCIMLKRDFALKSVLFEDGFTYVSEDQLFWAKVSLHGRIYLVDATLAKYRQHDKSSSSMLIESGDLLSDMDKFLNWLENYLFKTKIDDPNILKALETCKNENARRQKYKRILNFYRWVFPFHIRYWVRDMIIRWRTRN